eukprot:2003229-Rhodomonas_salina.1
MGGCQACFVLLPFSKWKDRRRMKTAPFSLVRLHLAPCPAGRCSSASNAWHPVLAGGTRVAHRELWIAVSFYNGIRAQVPRVSGYRVRDCDLYPGPGTR